VDEPINIRGSTGESAAAFFRHQWQLYGKFVDNNYLYHREVYGRLHRMLVDEAVQPFRFLDIACGGARATVETLKGTRVAHFYGIDLSPAALEHLLAPAKLSLMCEIRGIVGDTGLFLIYENASPDGEDRDAWLRRWERQNQPCGADGRGI